MIRHNKTPAHLNMIQSENLNSSDNLKTFINCVESIKVEDIKEEMNEVENDENLSSAGVIIITAEDIKCEIKEEEGVDDHSSIKHYNILDSFSDIKEEVKEEVIYDDSFY